MSEQSIPHYIEPSKLVNSICPTKGILELSSFADLKGLLVDLEGNVHVNLAFKREPDERNSIVLCSKLEANVTMICQRCLESVLVPIKSQCKYWVTNKDSVNSMVPRDCELLELEDGQLDVFGLVQEELLLSLPIVPLHNADACQLTSYFVQEKSSSDESVQSNPFSVLAQLKRDLKI